MAEGEDSQSGGSTTERIGFKKTLSMGRRNFIKEGGSFSRTDPSRTANISPEHITSLDSDNKLEPDSFLDNDNLKNLKVVVKKDPSPEDEGS